MKILDSVNYPLDLKKLNNKDLEQLAGEIRTLLVETVSEKGGHLSSNLGVVELTISLLKTFNLPDDKIVYDVGHQSYVHKILTGRKEAFSTLRTFGGVSGFPKPSESEYDAFETGHAGTAISVAYAIAEANRMSGKDDFAIAVVGDASLSNGLSMEGLNNAGRSSTKLIVILNDNEMSISPNVGNLRSYLTKLRTQPGYENFKTDVEKFLNKIPLAGKPISNVLKSTKLGIKHALIPGTLFEEMGFSYIGPVDGHNIYELTTALERAKSITQPVFIHVMTKKGKGYAYAENTPGIYHGIGKFDYKKPFVVKVDENSYSEIAGKKLTELGKKDERIVAICAAMEDGTGLYRFHKEIPERFFDVGISEEHAVTFGGGLASCGKIPVFAVYSTFLQRCYDNIIHDVVLSKRHMVFLVDRAGISGPDGETHQGIFDISMLMGIPGVKIYTPSTKKELEKAIETAVLCDNCPVFVRYPKGTAEVGTDVSDINKAVLLREGKDVTLVTMSKMTEVVKRAEFDGDHIHLNCIKPVDIEPILKSALKTGRVITAEDNITANAMGEKVALLLKENGFDGPVENMGLDIIPEHGSIDELLGKYGLDAQSINKRIYK